MSVARIRIHKDWKTWETFETYNAFVVRYAELKYLKIKFKVDEICCNCCFPRTEYGIKIMIEMATKENL